MCAATVQRHLNTMNPKLSPAENERLHEQLRAWKVDGGLPPGFRDAVWRRIEEKESQGRESAWMSILTRVASWVTRPAIAVGYVATLILLGTGIGVLGATREISQWEMDAAARYISVVDPLQPSTGR
jgi:hypothetical protein